MVTPSSKSESNSTLPCGRELKRRVTRSLSPEEYRRRLQALTEEHRLNQSRSREHILEVILKLGREKHFDAKTLVSAVQKAHPTLGMATVYRTLPLFVKAGILEESLSHEGGQTMYELNCDEHHDHIVCLNCGAIIEFIDKEIESLQEAVLEKKGFSEVRHQHIVYAKCHRFEKMQK